jgi:methionyl-tRNA synthetase
MTHDRISMTCMYVMHWIGSVEADYLRCQFSSGLISIFTMIYDANAFFQSSAPWTLKNDITKRDTVIHLCLEALRVVTLLLQVK